MALGNHNAGILIYRWSIAVPDLCPRSWVLLFGGWATPMTHLTALPVPAVLAKSLVYLKTFQNVVSGLLQSTRQQLTITFPLTS